MPSPVTNPFALGYTGPAKVQGAISADRLLVELTGEAIEIELVLLGLRADHAFTLASAADWIDAFIRRFKSRGTVYLPRPVHATRFIRSLADGGIFAGQIFMAGDDQSLNSRAADARICRVDPACPIFDHVGNRRTASTFDARRRTDLSLLWSSLTGPQFNHLLDAVLYAGVAGNMAGAKLSEETSTRNSAPPKSVGGTEDKKARRRSSSK